MPVSEGDQIMLCAPHGAVDSPRDAASVKMPSVACTAVHLHNMLLVGGRVAIADGPGAVWLECTKVLDHHRAVLSVTHGGSIRGGQCLTFPDNK